MGCPTYRLRPHGVSSKATARLPGLVALDKATLLSVPKIKGESCTQECYGPEAFARMRLCFLVESGPSTKLGSTRSDLWWMMMILRECQTQGR